MLGSGVAQEAAQAGDRIDVPGAERLGFGEFVREVVAQSQKDSLSAYAGNLTFRALFAIIPALVALLWLLKLIGSDWLIKHVVDIVTEAMPKAASGPIKQQLTAITGDQASGSLDLGLVSALLVAIWACCEFFRAASDALNAMYAVRESRPFVQRYLLSLALSIAVALLLATALFLVVFGSSVARQVENATGLGPTFEVLLTALTWVAIIGAVFCAYGLLYYFAPDVEQRVAWISGGTVAAVALWLLFALGFSFYANFFADYSRVYGALGGVAVLMIYLYVSCFILLLGAEMNQVIELHRSDGKREGRKHPDATAVRTDGRRTERGR